MHFCTIQEEDGNNDNIINMKDGAEIHFGRTQTDFCTMGSMESKQVLPFIDIIRTN
jgi:hypothetical protein